MSTSTKNLIFLPDYMDNFKLEENIFSNFIPKQQLYIFDISKLYKYQSNISLEIIKNSVVDYLNSLKHMHSKCIIVAKGLMATILCQVKNNFSFFKVILINPIFANALINPYTSNKPSYKRNVSAYWAQTLKEYYRANEIFIDKENDKFVKHYNFHIEHIDFIEKIIDTINDYLYLKKIKLNEKQYDLNNDIILLGKHNMVVDCAKTMSIIKKTNFNCEIIVFDKSCHHIEYDEPLKLFCLITLLLTN